MIEELLSVPAYPITVNGYSTVELNTSREIFLHSFRNTINKEIDKELDAKKLKKLIDSYHEKLDLPLVIALYRRYLWLEPTDTNMYYDFINYIDKTDQEKSILRNLVKDQNFDDVLEAVEAIFNDIFVNPTLIPPIKLRTLADITWELYQIEHALVDVASMKKTKAYDIRRDYLTEQIMQRVVDPKINIVELREFFTFKDITLSIFMYCDVGLEVAKRYLNVNPTDREIYGYICDFLSFWAFEEAYQLILQYIAVNDFDSALEIINRDYGYYNICSRFASHRDPVV